MIDIDGFHMAKTHADSIQPAQPPKKIADVIREFASQRADETIPDTPHAHDWRDIIVEQPESGFTPITNGDFLSSLAAPGYMLEVIDKLYKEHPDKQERYKELPKKLDNFINKILPLCNKQTLERVLN